MKDAPENREDKPGSTSAKPTGGAPIGTHSLTGGSANVGIPSSSPDASADLERVNPRAQPADADTAQDADSKPRGDIGEILGRKP